MVELVFVGRRTNFDAVADKVSVKTNKKTTQCQVVRWDASVEVTLVLVAERAEDRRHQPRVVIIDRDEHLDAVLLVQLLHYLCNRVRCEIGPGQASVHDVHEGLRVGQSVTQAVLHRFVVRFESLLFNIEELLLPIVGPRLASFIPVARAGLRVAILPARHVHFAIEGHVYREVLQDLFVLSLEVLENILSKVILEVEAVFVALNLGEGSIDKLVSCRKCPLDPVGLLVSPCSHIGKDLRFAATTFAPQQSPRIVSFPVGQSNSAHVFWPPVMIAKLVVALHVELVIYNIMFLQVGECTQVRLLQLKFDNWHDFAHL